jgi:hypothetical protein
MDRLLDRSLDIITKEVTNVPVKLIYQDWYIDGDYRTPLPNGIHPEVVRKVKTAIKNSNEQGGNIENFCQYFLSSIPEMFKFRCHSNFRHYYTKHNEPIEVEKLSNDTAIYLFPIEIMTTLESMCGEHKLVIDGVEYDGSFIKLLSPYILEQLQLGKIKLAINYIHDPISHPEQVNNFEKYMNSYGIDGSNIIYISGNYYTDEHKISSPNSKLRFSCGDLLLQQAAEKMLAYPYPGSLGYICENVTSKDLNIDYVRKHKFICFNRTIHHRHQRPVMAYFALKYNLLKDNIFSFIDNPDPEQIAYFIREIYDIDEESLKDYSEQISELLPYEIDTHQLSTMHEKTSFSVDNNRKDLYSESYLYITTETRFRDGTTPFLSEKTFRPIVNLQPFLYFGNYHSLKTLQNYGFKTFHPYIDESYDNEPDPKKRLLMLEQELVKFVNRPIQEIHDWYYSIIDILLYNQKHLATFKNFNPYGNFIKDIQEFYT